MNTKKTFTTTINEVTITASFNDLAENAGGSVLMEAGETVVLVTATMADKVATQDYFPLSVDFEERFYSVGAILGGRFMRREGRPSQEAVLNGRIIDRSIRPLFPKGFHKEVHVMATTISLGTYNHDVLAVIGASLALGTSSIPWNGPISSIRYTETDKGWSPFVPLDEAKECTNHILICGKEEHITMIEMEGREVSEEAVITVSEQALLDIAKLQEFQRDVIHQIGAVKQEVPSHEPSEEIVKLFEEHIAPTLSDAVFAKKDRQRHT